MKLSVSLGLWQDRPPAEALDTARVAEHAGYPELWIGEMATWDVFALATAIGAASTHLPLTLGPLAVAVRDPAIIATGAASVAALTGQPVDVALGTSSPLVVSQWHGRSRHKPSTALAESAQAVRELLDGHKSTMDGQVVHSLGYRLRLPATRSQLTVAAFGPAAIEVAAQHADRMVLNLLSPTTTAELIDQLHAVHSGRPRPRVGLWCTAAIDPDPEALEQCRKGIVGYLAAPGYADMFRRAGFADVVDFAQTGPHPRELLAAVPPELIATVGLFGTAGQVRARMQEYADAGVDELVVVPCATEADPAGASTLQALAGGARQ